MEFKIAPPRPGELAERLCGFANSRLGGMLIVGVADQTWEIVGVKSEAATLDVIIQACRLCKPPLTLTLPNQLEVVELRGKKVILAHIPPNTGVLYQAGGSYWLRRGTYTSPMDTAEVTSFLHRQGQLQWEAQPVLEATLEDLDNAKVQGYLEHLADLTKRPPRINDYTELLLKLKCAVRVVGGEQVGPKVYPTNAGLLLFGYAPRYLLTQAEVVATYYQDNSGVQRYTDRKTLVGTIPEQIDQVADVLRTWTPMGGRVEGFHRIDEPALPLESLREAVVNAVVHRDYSLAGTAVRIFYYPNRVEIHNPGVLPGNLSLERLRQGEAPSLPRNPILVSVLKDMPGGYMERVGSGIRFMINQMLDMKLPEPEFREQDEFVVTFYKAQATSSPGGVSQSELPLDLRRVGSPSVPQSVIEMVGPGERRAMAMQFVRENGAITHKQYRALTGVAETTAIRDLDGLVANGSLRKVGSGPGRKYVQ